MTADCGPLPEAILSGTGKAQGDGSLSRQLCTVQAVCITGKQSNWVHGCLRVFTRRVVSAVGVWESAMETSSNSKKTLHV